MVFPESRVHDMKSFVPPLETLLDERAKHPVLLVHAVEESANVTMLAQIASGTPHGTAVGHHVSPPPLTACSGLSGRKRPYQRKDLLR
jgi:hypothetical protein